MATWDSAYINGLPDSAFAVVQAGGTRDASGRTVPRNLRALPHHAAGGAVDLPHLRNALARASQATDLSAAERATAQAHLEAHARAAGVGAPAAAAATAGRAQPASSAALLIRAAPLELEQPDSADSDGELVARLTAWDTWSDVSDDGRTRYRERFARGALSESAEPMLVYAWHLPRADGTIERGEVIGHVPPGGLTDDQDGPHVRAVIADTATWRDHYRPLIRAGTLRAVSAEFDTPQGGRQVARNGAVTVARATLRALALALHPQHRSAAILSARSGVHVMPTQQPLPGPDEPEEPEPEPEPAPVTVAELIAHPEVRRQIRDAAQAVVLAGGGGAPRVMSDFPTLGTYIRAQFEEPARADRFARALAENITTESPGLMPPTWVREIVGIVGLGRPLVSAFTTRPLPDTGNVLQWPVVTSKPKVAEQTPELTEIATQKVSFGQDSSPVRTFTSGDRASLQLILRSDPSYVESLYELFANEYAAAIDTAAGAELTTKVTQNVALALADQTSPAKWQAALVDAMEQVMANGLRSPNVAVISTSMWKSLVSLADTNGRPLYPTVNPSNAQGTATMPPSVGQLRPALEIDGIPAYVDPHLTAGTGYVGFAGAFITYESPGAPVRIQQEVISVLGRDLGIYGFVSFATREPKAICRLTMSGTAAAEAGAGGGARK